MALTNVMKIYFYLVIVFELEYALWWGEWVWRTKKREKEGKREGKIQLEMKKILMIQLDFYLILLMVSLE